MVTSGGYMIITTDLSSRGLRSTMLSPGWPSLGPLTALLGRNYVFHFTDEETETQGG